MLATKPIAFLAAALLVGALLAIASLALHVPTGWVGGAALIGWALFARRRWARLEETTGLEPGAPERILWVNLAGDGLILGHLATALLQREVDFHFGQGNSLALDSWTLVAASFVVLALFRSDSRERDERHAPVVAQGVRAGYAALIVMMIALAFYLAFGAEGARPPISFFFLANLIVALLLASHVAMLLTQLAAYARDTRAAMAADEPDAAESGP